MRPPSGSAVQAKRSTLPSASLMLIGVESPVRTISMRLGDVGVQFILGKLVSAGIAAMIHQRDEWRLAVGLARRAAKNNREGAVDEFRAGLGVEQNDAEVDPVERGRQALGGGVVHALRERRLPSISCRDSPVMAAVPPTAIDSADKRIRSAVLKTQGRSRLNQKEQRRHPIPAIAATGRSR